ncbi:unnamed protein product [Agarophyton chilense]|eukprot:gb/GEZJ01002989.1/.p1 GENE.gb/GEZJ01002989.1/~~gb/GEZJ01002989.1/.p1  ORF type:complete len:400 (-),score=55.78 gb/GEZJ01002989.1/:1686-2858(-)
MRFRSGPPRGFAVALTVHQLDSIPPIHQLLYVHWRARRASPQEGRTPSLPVEPGNVIRWGFHAHFTIPIHSDPADHTLLQPAQLLLQLRSERRARWVGAASSFEGTVTVDLAEVAAVGFLSRNYLVQGSLLNTTLKLSIRVTHKSGDKIFRTRTLPHISTTPGKPCTPSTPAPATPNTSAADSAHHNALFEDDDPTSSLERSTQFDNPPKERQLSSHGLSPALSITKLPSNGSFTSSHSTPAPGPASFRNPEPASSAFFELVQTPSAVLESSIPNPELLQKDIYETIFQQRMRDQWPDHIVQSRVNALSAVNAIYAAISQADGIGLATVSEAASEANRTKLDQTLCLDHLIESRANPDTSLPPLIASRRPSNRSLSVRSSSTSELKELAN